MYDLQFSLTACSWSQCLSGLTLFVFGIWSILFQRKNFTANYGVHLYTGFTYFLCGLVLKFLTLTKSKTKVRICMVIQFLSSLAAFSSSAIACYLTMKTEAFKALGSIIFYMSWMCVSAIAFFAFSIGMSLCVIKEAQLVIHPLINPLQLDRGSTLYTLRGVNFQNRVVSTGDILGDPPPYTRYPQEPITTTTTESLQSTQENRVSMSLHIISETVH